MSGKKRMETKRIYFMRHGRVHKQGDYSKLSYEKLIHYLTEKNPPLEKNGNKNNEKLFKKIISWLRGESSELQKYDLESVPRDIEVIFTSPARRSLQTANIVKDSFDEKIKIDDSWKDYLAEVPFSRKILTKKEFKKYNGWDGCRPLILERWLKGENEESLQETYERVIKLDEEIRKSRYNKILLLTHGFFLRAVYLFYTLNLDLNNGKLSEDKEILTALLKAPRLKYGGMLEYALNGKTTPLSHDISDENNEPYVLEKIIRKENKQKPVSYSGI